jgi:CRP-like cAMP-binding protein
MCAAIPKLPGYQALLDASDDAADDLLLRAAFPHLELALYNLLNINRQNSAILDKDALLEAARFLEKLACSEVQISEITLPSSIQQEPIGIQRIGPRISCKDIVLAEAMSPDTLVGIAECKDPEISLLSSIKESEVSTADADDTELPATSRELTRMLMNFFESLDLNHNAEISHAELREAFISVGCPAPHLQKLFEHIDTNKDGGIDRVEWAHVVQRFLQKEEDPEIKIFLIRLVEEGTKARKHARRPERCLLLHTSLSRMGWDMWIVFCLAYILLSLPLSFAFGSGIQLLETVDTAVDYVFLCDVLLNFRTTYVNPDQMLVRDGKTIATHYLKTWFVPDLLSSLPLKQMTAGLIPRFQPMKLMKIGKVAKVFKMMRLGRTFRILATNQIITDIEEFIWHTGLLTAAQTLSVLLKLMLFGHWLACGLIAVQGDALREYFRLDSLEGVSKQELYNAALYWSMMTMTTVGYGDVSMRTHSERAYAIIVMIIGGAFYGYVVGHVTSIMVDRGYAQRSVKERMEVVTSWLRTHPELPRVLRKRVWRHFKITLTTTHTIDDFLILNDLPPSLIEDVAFFLLDSNIRCNPLFEGLPPHAIGRLLAVTEEATFEAKEVMVSSDFDVKEPGMFVIKLGTAILTRSDGNPRELSDGESFGEEVLLGFDKHYGYTVTAKTRMMVYRIDKERFAKEFEGHPELMERMEQCVIDKGKVEFPQRCAAKGRASLLTGGASGVSPSFPEAVMDSMEAMEHKLETKVLSSLWSMEAKIEMEVRKLMDMLAQIQAIPQKASAITEVAVASM